MNANIRLLCMASALLGAAAQAADLAMPEGNGKQIVQSACVICHEIDPILRSGYDEESWRNNINMMVNIGAPVPKEEVENVIQYLAKNFPEKPKPPAVLVAGDVKASIEEWPVPTPGSRPHDPLATPDGAIWYSGQFANVLGRLDPVTKQIREYKLDPMTGPHGLINDKDGNIWYASNFGSHIGRLDPKTGKFVKYPMPDPKVKDVHTLIWGHNGMLYFTAQVGNVVGRLNPQTGEIRLMPSPTAKSRPYGLVVNSKGIPFFVEFGTNKVSSIDPDTLAITEYEMPHKESRPRRIAITSDDVIWLSDYARGYLVRFDPKTEKFQSWAIPSGGKVVRNVSVTRDGNIAIACSGMNRIGLVTIQQ